MKIDPQDINETLNRTVQEHLTTAKQLQKSHDRDILKGKFALAGVVVGSVVGIAAAVIVIKDARK